MNEVANSPERTLCSEQPIPNPYSKCVDAPVWQVVVVYVVLHITLWIKLTIHAWLVDDFGIATLMVQVASEYVRIALLAAIVMQLIEWRKSPLTISLATVVVVAIAIRPELCLFYPTSDWIPQFAMEYGAPVLVAIILSLIVSPYLSGLLNRNEPVSVPVPPRSTFPVSYLLLATGLAAFLAWMLRAFGSESLIRTAIGFGVSAWSVASTALAVFRAKRLRVWMLALLPFHALLIAIPLAMMVSWKPNFVGFGVLECSYAVMIAAITLWLRSCAKRNCMLI